MCALSLVVFLCASCGRSCEDAKVGEIQLMESSLNFVPYVEGQVLSYVNANGDELTFNVEVIESFGKLCTKYVCSNTSSPFQNTPCEYVESSNIRYVLRSGDSLIIDINLVVENYEEESMLFYDLLSTHFSGVGALASASHVTNIHFNEPAFDTSSIFRGPYYAFKAEYMLNNQTLNDVLISPEGSNQIILKEGEGIIALKYLNETFH